MAFRKMYTTSEVARLLGKPGNRKLIMALIRHNDIPAMKTGASILVDEEGLELIRAAVERWDNRPKVIRDSRSA